MKIQPMSPKELALSGLSGAAALVLPIVFHMIQLGRVFMPMYIPLMALSFLVRPIVAMTAGFLVPLLSAILTGMPPLYPPVAAAMAVELALMCSLTSSLHKRLPEVNTLFVLVPALVLGRFINTGILFLIAQWAGLPPKFLASLSFVSGWPGVVLMSVVIPTLITQFASIQHHEVSINESTHRQKEQNHVF